MGRTIPTRIDVPVDLRRRLREAAERRGCSASDLILEGIRWVLDRDEPASPPVAAAATDDPQAG